MVKKILFFVLLGLLLLFLSGLSLSVEENLCKGNYFLLELEFSSGNVYLLNKSIQTGCSPDTKGDFEYSYALTKDDAVLYSGKFNSDILFIDNFVDENMQGGAIPVDNQKIFLTIPYIKDTDDLQILKQEEKIFETKIYDAGSSSCKIK